VAHSTPKLNRGCFTVDSAAYVAGLSRELVRRWAFGVGRDHKPVLIAEADGDCLTFVDVIQLMSLRNLRRVEEVPLDRIQQAIQVAHHDYGIEFPFARRHQTYMLGKEILLNVDGIMVQISGKQRHQQLVPRLVAKYIKELSFGSNGLANCYTAMRRGAYSVQLDPMRALGHPMVLPVHMTVGAIVEVVQTEGSVERAARMLDIPRAAVKLATDYDAKQLAAVSSKAA
jgi:uncharacterized protein (DUF433 family)